MLDLQRLADMAHHPLIVHSDHRRGPDSVASASRIQLAPAPAPHFPSRYASQRQFGRFVTHASTFAVTPTGAAGSHSPPELGTPPGSGSGAVLRAKPFPREGRQRGLGLSAHPDSPRRMGLPIDILLPPGSSINARKSNPHSTPPLRLLPPSIPSAPRHWNCRRSPARAWTGDAPGLRSISLKSRPPAPSAAGHPPRIPQEAGNRIGGPLSDPGRGGHLLGWRPLRTRRYLSRNTCESDRRQQSSPALTGSSRPVGDDESARMLFPALREHCALATKSAWAVRGVPEPNAHCRRGTFHQPAARTGTHAFFPIPFALGGQPCVLRPRKRRMSPCPRPVLLWR
jgi:hypothetical protein